MVIYHIFGSSAAGLLYPQSQLAAAECFAACGKLCLLWILGLAIPGAPADGYSGQYSAGWKISQQDDKNRGKKRLWLGMAVGFDLLVLAVFKYFNFFDESLVNLLSSFGLHLDLVSLKIILPLGISFFTFMSITYPFDIYRGKMSHTRSLPDFALFVAFFPTIVSGPVERASHMLPQFQSPRMVSSDKVNEGLWLISWGFFQKLVIADNMGLLVNQVYNNQIKFEGLDIIIATLAYACPPVRGLIYGAILVVIVIFSQRVISRFIYQGF